MRFVIKIVAQNQQFLVIDKPGGMVVNRVKSAKGETVEEWLEKHGVGKGLERRGIVHRLDKETSGLLVIAKNRASLESLRRQFKERLVKKKYWCLVHGWLRPRQGKVEAGVSRSRFNRKKFGVFVGGKAAVSDYQVIGDYEVDDQRFSLVEVKPETGRTHQIRVHMKHLGYPVVADEMYAGRKTARKDREWCSRLFLQAKELVFMDLDGKKREFKLKLAADLQQVISKLKKVDSKA